MAHPGGRPIEHDRLKIGREMIEWARNNPEGLTVPMYATSVGLHSGILRKWCTECEQFSAMYNEAKEIIGLNRLNAMRQDTLSDSVYMKTLTHFDFDSKAEVREEKAFESSLRKDEEGTKKTNITLMVPNGLAIGSDVRSEGISTENNTSSK